MVLCNIGNYLIKRQSGRYPVDTRRRFNVDATSYDVVRRRIDVETTSCVYRGNIRNYSSEVINIHRRKVELNIKLPRVNNFNIKQKRHGIFVLLYATSTKQNLAR